MFTVPGTTVKRELAKDIVTALLGGKINVETMDDIFSEVDKADYTTSDPTIIIQAKEAGLVSERTASMALGFSEDEYLQARKDHTERAARILLAQTSARQAGGEDTESAGARGVEDISAEPTGEGKEERGQATETALKETTKKPQRGEAK
jgi:hypothetical protein